MAKPLWDGRQRCSLRAAVARHVEMELTPEQVAAFDERGLCFVHSVFAASEIAGLRDELPRLLARSGDEVVREPDADGAVRIVYGCHTFSERFQALSRHPRLLQPVQQLLRESVYIHQTRLNPKQAFGGGVWDWHQDYGTWQLVDGMREPRAIMAAVFLEDVDATNAPLLIVPRSQSHGLIDSASRDTEVGYVIRKIDEPTLTELAAASPVEALVGPTGSVAFLHCNIVHGSSNNVSPKDRTIFYLNYNACSNATTGLGVEGRGWWHCNTDATPLTALADDCLLAAGPGGSENARL